MTTPTATAKKSFTMDDEDEQPKPIPVSTAPAAVATTEAAPPQAATTGGKKVHAVVDDEDEAPAKATEEEVEDLDTEWGDQKVINAAAGLQKLTPAKGTVVRFAILPLPAPKRAQVHYIQGKGKVRCQSTDEHTALCCKKLGEPDLRIVALVVHYTNANPTDGKYGAGSAIEYDIKFVYLSPTNYRQISMLPEEDQKVTDIDIRMTQPNPNKAGWEFSKISSKALYRKNAELLAEINQIVERKYADGKLLIRKLGKKMTALELKAFIASLAASAEDASLSDVNDL